MCGMSGKESTSQCTRNRRCKVQPLSREGPLEEQMSPHSSILAWKIPRAEEPGGLQSTGPQRVGYDWAAHTLYYSFNHKWNCALQPILKSPAVPSISWVVLVSVQLTCSWASGWLEVFCGCDIIRREPSVRSLVRSRDFTYVGALRIVLTQNRQAFHVLLFICLFSLPSVVYIAISNFLIISNKATMNLLELVLIHSHLG